MARKINEVMSRLKNVLSLEEKNRLSKEKRKNNRRTEVETRKKQNLAEKIRKRKAEKFLKPRNLNKLFRQNKFPYYVQQYNNPNATGKIHSYVIAPKTKSNYELKSTSREIRKTPKIKVVFVLMFKNTNNEVYAVEVDQKNQYLLNEEESQRLENFLRDELTLENIFKEHKQNR